VYVTNKTETADGRWSEVQSDEVNSYGVWGKIGADLLDRYSLNCHPAILSVVKKIEKWAGRPQPTKIPSWLTISMDFHGLL
jgi:hypothetical protein